MPGLPSVVGTKDRITFASLAFFGLGVTTQSGDYRWSNRFTSSIIEETRLALFFFFFFFFLLLQPTSKFVWFAVFAICFLDFQSVSAFTDQACNAFICHGDLSAWDRRVFGIFLFSSSSFFFSFFFFFWGGGGGGGVGVRENVGSFGGGLMIIK